MERETMCRAQVLLFVMVAALTPLSTLAPQDTEDASPHSDAELISEVLTAVPGVPFTVGLMLTLDPGWHSYWKNPGDAGQPAFIQWDVPAGYKVGDISWPFPHIVESSSVVSYGYDHEVMLLTEIAPPRYLTVPQTVTFRAEAHWLVCKNICLPAEADLVVEVEIVGDSSRPNVDWRESFADARSRLPVIVDDWNMSAVRGDSGYVLEISPAGHEHFPFEGAFFYAGERGIIDHGAPQPVSEMNGKVRITLQMSPYARGEPDRLRGILVLPEAVNLGARSVRAVVVDAPVADRSS